MVHFISGLQEEVNSQSAKSDWLTNSVEFVCGRTCRTCYPGCLSRMLCREKDKKHTHTHMHKPHRNVNQTDHIGEPTVVTS